MMIRVGLTGGIGSGKSTLARFFSLLGVPVYYADLKARYLMENNAKLKTGISTLFGDKAYPDGNVLDRQFIADKVFSDKILLEKLNAMVHPFVRQDYIDWLEQNNDSVYSIIESAILFESGFDRFTDKTLLIWAPAKLRVARVCKRDNTTARKVIERIKTQSDQDDLKNKVDLYIINDDQMAVIPQVLQIHHQLTH